MEKQKKEAVCVGGGVCGCVYLSISPSSLFTHTQTEKEDLEYLRVYLQAFSLATVVDIIAVQ